MIKILDSFLGEKKITKKNIFQKIDEKDILIDSNDIILFAIFRNEALRLPYFLDYYKKLGVNKFFFIDNNSTDHSKKIVLEDPLSHVFFTNETYSNHWNWMEYLLERYGKGKWCLVVDIDELFAYPHSDEITLHNLITYMEVNQFTSISCFLLDMYSNKNINCLKYQSGEDPLEILSYFDAKFETISFGLYDRKNKEEININAYTGGMRARVFGKMDLADILTKIPFFKFEDRVYLVQGMHAVTYTNPSDIEGVVFHTKFLNDFIEEVNEEVLREQHFHKGIRYKHFKRTLDNSCDLNLYYKKSIKYENKEQLLDLNIMKTSCKFEDHFAKLLNI